jgi:hypothetical protein
MDARTMMEGITTMQHVKIQRHVIPVQQEMVQVRLDAYAEKLMDTKELIHLQCL